jgi:hypothetical protein
MTVENTFGFESGDGTIPQDVADAIAATLVGSDWLSGRSTAITLTRVRVEDVYPGTAATGENILVAPEAGDDPGNAAPPLCALVVQWRGLSKGKAGRGRMYLTGFPASTAVGGFWTSDALDPASAAASILFDAYGPQGSDNLTIINRFAGGVKLDPPLGTLVKAFTVDNVVRRIGRREQQRGI